MKNTTILSIGMLCLGAIPSQAQTSAVTDPSGYSTVDITPAPSAGQSALTGFSIALRNPSLVNGVTTGITANTLTESGAAWSAAQWTTEPHLVYITNAAGSEEAFLITAHTADTLTLSSAFDLTARYGNGSGGNARNYHIVKAQTFGNLFGTSSVELQTGSLSTADLIYVWDGSNWVTYYHNGTSWRRTGSFSNVNNDVIFPDEGVFLLRRGTASLSLVFTGSVPVKSQVTTIPGGQLTMIGNRYPVSTTVAQLGLQNLTNWQTGSISSGDRFFIWNGSSWVTYYYNGTNWRRSGSFSSVDNEVIPGGSMIFVLRESSAGAADTGNVHTMPYTLD